MLWRKYLPSRSLLSGDSFLASNWCWWNLAILKGPPPWDLDRGCLLALLLPLLISTTHPPLPPVNYESSSINTPPWCVWRDPLRCRSTAQRYNLNIFFWGFFLKKFQSILAYVRNLGQMAWIFNVGNNSFFAFSSRFLCEDETNSAKWCSLKLVIHMLFFFFRHF